MGENLRDLWRLRAAAATTLGLAEDQLRRAVCAASVEELVALIETFSPARSAGPEWTRGFEPLVERLWAWRDAETIAALEAAFRARGLPWAPVANAFAEEQGTAQRARLRHPAWARQPAFAQG